MSEFMEYDGNYFKADISSVDGKFRLYDLSENKILDVARGSAFSSLGYGHAENYLENAIRELEEIKEKLQ